MMEEYRKVKGGKSQSRKPEKVSKTMTVELGRLSDDDNDFIGEEASSDSEGVVCAQLAVAANASKADHTNNWMVDSACSRSMMPTAFNGASVKADSTTIKLADDSTIKSTHW